MTADTDTALRWLTTLRGPRSRRAKESYRRGRGGGPVNIYSRVEVPEELLNNREPQFTSECMKEVSRLLSIRHLTISPYHPMCNGLVKRFNAKLKTMLKRLCSEKPRQWDRYINAFLFAYREVPQQFTGFAPFELLYGSTVKKPMTILRSIWTEEEGQIEARTSYQYVFELREKLEEIIKVDREKLERSQGRYKQYFDKRSKERRFDVADEVLVLLPTDNNKLLMHWRGPFRVTKIVAISDYEVKVRGKKKINHANLLKRYRSRSDTDGNICERTTGGSLLEFAPSCRFDLYRHASIQLQTTDDGIVWNPYCKFFLFNPLRSCTNVRFFRNFSYWGCVAGLYLVIVQSLYSFTLYWFDLIGSIFKTL